jgi:hypothetical protein
MYFWLFFLQNEHLEVGSEVDCVILDIDMSTGIFDVSLRPELITELKDQVTSYHKIQTTYKKNNVKFEHMETTVHFKANFVFFFSNPQWRLYMREWKFPVVSN